MFLKRVRLRVGLVLALGCAGLAGPAGATPRFEVVGRGEIPRQVVKTVAQDGQGFLWIATGDGLVRYDGYRFRPIERAHADPGRRNLGWVKAMLAGRDGRMWISSEADGLVHHDPVRDRIVEHAGPEGATPVHALAEDDTGAIWAGMLGGGLARHVVPRDGGPAQVTRLRHRADQPDGLPDDRVEAIAFDDAGTLWLGSWAGLSRRDRGDERFVPVPARAGAAPLPGLQGRRVLALLATPKRPLWVGTMQGDLVMVDRGSGAARWLPAPPGGRGAVTALARTDDGRVWVGTELGLEVWDADGLTLLHRLRHDPRRPDGLPADAITSLLKDRTGALWVGGLGTGLLRHDPKDVGLSVRRADLDGGFDGNAHGLLALDDGQVWATTSSVPLVAMDERLKVRRALPLPKDGDGLPITRVQAMALDRAGRAWLAAGEWLLELDRDGRTRSLRRHGAGEIVLMTAGRGGLWLAAQDGLFHLPADAGAQSPPAAMPGADGHRPMGMAVYAMAEAPDGTLWVGGARGLFRLAADRRAGLEPVTSPPGQGLGFPVVAGLLLGRDGTLWVDTAVNGLHRSISQDGARVGFDAVSARHGIRNRPYGVNLLEDRRGRIWTQQYVYDPAADRLLELTAADGKDFGMGWFYAYAATPDGRFLFGGTHGVLVVQPERYEGSADMPPLAVTSLRIDGRPRPLAGLPGRIALGPEHHGISIEFAALEFSDPRRIRYAYRLDGVDQDWVPTGADFRVASYGNLRPGDYTLRIKATNRNGVWNPAELAIPVSVAPAWWQRRDLQVLAALLGLLALLATVRHRTRQLVARQRELEQKVRERTLALEATTRELQAKSAELEQASLTDPLSGLHNRRFLQQHIEADAARAVRRGAAGSGADDGDLTFFLVDIDHFKAVNDRLGHPAGDAVIRQIPARLRAVFRAGDHLVRWGGEEFLIVVRDSSREAAAELAERARAAIADEPFALDDGQRLHCSGSIGFACFPLDPARPDALAWHEVVSVADAALLRAKQEGRDRWVGVVEADVRQRPANPADWFDAAGTTVRRRGDGPMAPSLPGSGAAV